MTKRPLLGRQLLATAILAAPFIAWLFGGEAALVVMALTLCAGSYLLAGVFDAAPSHIRRWLRLGIGANVMLAVTCLGLAIWLWLR